MHQQNQKANLTPSTQKDTEKPDVDLRSAIIPQSVRLEPVHRNRERSISEAIENPRRDPFDRIGLAAERVMDFILSREVRMDTRRVLAWSTRRQDRQTIELDGVAKGEIFLEYKVTFSPERASKQCAGQLVKARAIYLTGRPTSACRGVGVVVDCGELVGLTPPEQVATIKSVVEAIRNGRDAYSVKVVPFREVAEYFRRSKYGELLSAEALRAAYWRRMQSDPPPKT